MRIFQIIKFLIIFPFAWIDSLIYSKKTHAESYRKAQLWSKFILPYLGYELLVEGEENIPENTPVFFVSNHQGTIDPALVVASSHVPLSFISKIQNEKIPVLGRWSTNIGTIHFDRDTREGNVHMLREAIRYLKKGKNLLIFPEGTRSKGDKMNEFKIGALQPAYMAKATLLPITLNNAYCIDVKTKNKKLKITYGKPIYYEEYKHIKHEEMTKILHDKIEENINKW